VLPGFEVVRGFRDSIEVKGIILVARGNIETIEVFMNGMSAIRGGGGITNVILKVWWWFMCSM
jgi:hypothetical protein